MDNHDNTRPVTDPNTLRAVIYKALPGAVYKDQPLSQARLAGGPHRYDYRHDKSCWMDVCPGSNIPARIVSKFKHLPGAIKISDVMVLETANGQPRAYYLDEGEVWRSIDFTQWNDDADKKKEDDEHE